MGENIAAAGKRAKGKPPKLRSGPGNGAPLWQAVSTLILQRIRDGRYPVGLPLPREVDLESELKVSRSTVREAIRVLAADGFLIPRKRAGTIVVSAGRDGPMRVHVEELRALERLIESSRIRVLERARAPLPAGVRQAYPEAQPGDWLRISTVRQTVAEGRNLFSSEVYLHPRLESIEPLLQHVRGSVFELIERQTGEHIVRVDSVIKPSTIGAEAAGILQLPPGSLGLVVSRRMVTKKGELVEVAETFLPESRYEIETSFALPWQRPDDSGQAPLPGAAAARLNGKRT